MTLSDEQLLERLIETDGIGHLQPTLVRASAGTGKTYQLTARLMRILFQGASPEAILATTFTRKAAAEILERVLVVLARAADPENDAALQQLRDQVEIPSLPRSACLALLSRVMQNIHRVRICTLDSLFSQLARAFPFELNLPPGWRLLDEIEERWTRQRAVNALILSLEPAEVTALLSMLGKGDVARSIAGEVMTVVEAAFNQQRQATADAWDQLHVNVIPDSSDLTRAAGYLLSAEAKQKTVRGKLDQLAHACESRQFHLLEEDTLLINYNKSKRTGCDLKYGNAKLPPGLESSLELIYQAVRTEVLSLLRAQNHATGQILGDYDRCLHQLRQTARALAFDDIAIRLATAFNQLDRVSLENRLDGTIRHVLLDEFQDTSPVQWTVLRYFASQAAKRDVEKVASSERPMIENSFFCVGDTKQAIYGWRGGVAEIFDSVVQEIEGVQEIQQNVSYRTSPVVLDVVNETFRNLTKHGIVGDADDENPADKSFYEARSVRHFARHFPVHSAAKSHLAGYFRFETAGPTPDIECPPELAETANVFEHASRVVAEIHQRYPEKTIGVLTRTNVAVAEMIYFLSQHDFDASQEGGNPLTDSAAVEVLLSAVMLAEHPVDLRWRFHVLHTPLTDWLGDGEPSLSDQADSIRMSMIIRQLIEREGLVSSLFFMGQLLAASATQHDQVRLRQLYQVALEYEPRSTNRLRDFVELVRVKKVERPRAAKIRVMTVHQSKGLEFDAVVLPELDAALTRASTNCIADRAKPSDPPEALSRYLSAKSWHYLPERWQRAFGKQTATEVTEALCLLYVAMTRARQALHIVIPAQSNTKFNKKTAASLVYHALGLTTPATEKGTVLLEVGDPNWGRSDSVRQEPTVTAKLDQKRIRFQPLPPVPRRHRPLSNT